MVSTYLLAAALALSPAQPTGLGFSNDRITLGGEFGPPRAENKLLPGDRFFLAFDIEGLKLDEMNKASFTIGMTVADKSGNLVYEVKPARQETVLPLGGTKLPARAFMDTTPDMAAGEYVCRVMVKDLATNDSKTLEKKFEMLPKGFGVVSFYCSGDDKGEVPAPFMGVAGQAIWLHFVVVGFERAGNAAQPDIEISFQTLDSNQKPTSPQPRIFQVRQEIPENVLRIPISLPLPLNRVGAYTIEIVAKDRLSNRNTKVTIPLTVLPTVK